MEGGLITSKPQLQLILLSAPPRLSEQQLAATKTRRAGQVTRRGRGEVQTKRCP